jgi:Protein of unknown function (DUF2752)
MSAIVKFRNRRTIPVALFAGSAGLALLRLYDPASSGLFPPCPLHYFTGLYCPGCGSLRALHQLLLGNWHTAWAMNPLTCVLLPFLIYGLASELGLWLRGRPLPQIFIPGKWIYVLCAVIVLFGILRNLPFYPFDLLAPGAMLRL